MIHRTLLFLLACLFALAAPASAHTTASRLPVVPPPAAQLCMNIGDIEDSALTLQLDGLHDRAGPCGGVLVRQNPWSAFDPEGLSGEAVRIGAWTTGGAMTGAALGLMVCAPAGEVPSPVVVPTFAAVGAAAGFIAGAVSEGLNYLANNFSAPRPLFPTTIGGGFSPPPRFDSTTVTTPTPALPPLPGFGSTTPTPPLVLGGAPPVQLPNVLITAPADSARDIAMERKGLNGPTTIYVGDDGYWGITNDFARREKEWAKEGRAITPWAEAPDRKTARGVEQIKIEEGRAKGNEANLEQNNSIDPTRKDPRAQEMRKLGEKFLDDKAQ